MSLEDNDDEAMISNITSKLELVLAAKSRRLQYMSSPIVSHHVSLSLSSSPDDSLSRASVPFSWEEEPGKPKHYRLRHPSVSKCLVLPPRLLLPEDITKTPITANHHPLRLAGFKRWFRWRKERSVSGYVSGKCNLCLLLLCKQAVPWKNKKLDQEAKKIAYEGDLL